MTRIDLAFCENVVVDERSCRAVLHGKLPVRERLRCPVRVLNRDSDIWILRKANHEIAEPRDVILQGIMVVHFRKVVNDEQPIHGSIFIGIGHGKRVLERFIFFTQRQDTVVRIDRRNHYLLSSYLIDRLLGSRRPTGEYRHKSIRHYTEVCAVFIVNRRIVDIVLVTV